MFSTSRRLEPAQKTGGEYVALRSTLSQRGGAKFVDEWVIRSEGRTPSKSPEPKYLGENARQQSPRAGAMFVDDWVVRTEVNRARSKSAGKERIRIHDLRNEQTSRLRNTAVSRHDVKHEFQEKYVTSKRPTSAAQRSLNIGSAQSKAIERAKVGCADEGPMDAKEKVVTRNDLKHAYLSIKDLTSKKATKLQEVEALNI